MPLSSPASRQLLHTRNITCLCFHRDDGLWEIEGRLTDRKDYSFENENRGEVDAGEPVHDMWLRVTLNDNLFITNVEASTDASPYTICPEITKNFSLLKGLTIGPGWRKAVKNKVGGIHGCTHLVELLGPIATTAYQTIFSEKAQTFKKYKSPQSKTKMVSEEERYKPRLLNTCHAFGESSSVVKKRWPNFYKLK